jgi:hypothetical protein
MVARIILNRLLQDIFVRRSSQIGLMSFFFHAGGQRSLIPSRLPLIDGARLNRKE